ncbi:unnamed protein product [Rotaria sordida]|uniref:Uncharacterized protein n=1 Tax=Rotaria sordida TaxID=392033 RepID=A0A814QY29_9BILA|nr:unnamed protein product [Rotaria sordida]CAF3750083.1 unnamed protein product [Rotaria sordida]
MKANRNLLVIIQSLIPIQIFLRYCFVIELTFLYLWWSNSDLKIYADSKNIEHLRQEYAICLLNHRYEIDWLITLVYANKLCLLGGIEIVGKHSLSLIPPVLDWSWFFMELIFYVIFMTCNGTRYTETKRLESMKYTREKNLSELKYHILRRIKGLTLIMQGTQGKILAVYNFMLDFSKDDTSPTLRTLLNGHSCKAHLQTLISEIPYQNEGNVFSVKTSVQMVKV